jgi:hypothetical protein
MKKYWFDRPLIKQIIPPRNGWKACSWYLVDVSYNDGNPIHRQLFYTGFLNGNEKGTKPGGYNFITAQGDSDYGHKINDIYYMRAIRLLVNEKEFE